MCFGDAKKSQYSSFLQAASKPGQGCSFHVALLQCWRPTATSPELTCQTLPALLLSLAAAFWGCPGPCCAQRSSPALKQGYPTKSRGKMRSSRLAKGKAVTERQHFVMKVVTVGMLFSRNLTV